MSQLITSSINSYISGGSSPNETLANAIDNYVKDEQQDIKDVYIGVFFDGTSNNMHFISPTASKKGDNQEFSYEMIHQKANENTKRIEKEIKIKSEEPNGQIALEHKNTHADFSPLYAKLNPILTNVQNKLTEKLKSLISNDNDARYHYENAEEYAASSEEFKIRQVRGDFDNPTEKQKSELQYSKLSNVAFLTSLYQGVEKEKRNNSKVYNIYIEGAGATAFSDVGETDAIGLAFGVGVTGVVGLVSKAVRMVTNYLSSLGLTRTEKEKLKIHFDVFGFSRGSACARLFAYLVARDRDAKVLPREKEFRKYLNEKYFSSQKSQIERTSDFIKKLVSTNARRSKDISSEEDKVIFLEEYNPKNVHVDFLGIYDTVASIGLLKLDKKDDYHLSFKKNEDKDPKRPKNGYVNGLYMGVNAKEDYRNNFHCDNVVNYGLYSPFLSRVNHTLHIGALYEFRENFAFTNIGEKLPDNGVEVLMPGSHSDIGGGHLMGDVNHVTIFLEKYPRGKIELTNPTHMNMQFPWQDGLSPKISRVSKQTLEELGWKWDDKDNRNQYKEFSYEVNEKQVTYGIDFWSDPKIGYKYSNITLHMMIKSANKKVSDRKMFDVDLKKTHPRISIPEDLNSFYSEIMSQMESFSTSNRYCILPGGAYNSEAYKKLRSEYIHYTSTDLWNFKLFKNATEEEQAIYKWGKEKNNYGNVLGANAPNRYNNIICRITYNGDEKADNELHYLPQLNIPKGNIKNVNFG